MLTAKCIQDVDSWGNIKLPLEIDKIYEVKSIDMGGFYTSVYLKGFKTGFNSICFEFYENGKSIDIYKDRRYNLYL